MKKYIKYIPYFFIVLLFVMATITTISVKVKKNKIIELTEQIDSLKKYNKELAEINGINVNVTFQLEQKNILSFSANNCQNIAKEVAQMTREALLDSLKNNSK